MNLIEALTDEDNDMRVTCGDRWLITEWTEHGIYFTVYERKKYAKSTLVIIGTNSQENAVRELIK